MVEYLAKKLGNRLLDLSRMMFRLRTEFRLQCKMSLEDVKCHVETYVHNRQEATHHVVVHLLNVFKKRMTRNHLKKSSLIFEELQAQGYALYTPDIMTEIPVREFVDAIEDAVPHLFYIDPIDCRITFGSVFAERLDLKGILKAVIDSTSA